MKKTLLLLMTCWLTLAAEAQPAGTSVASDFSGAKWIAMDADSTILFPTSTC